MKKTIASIIVLFLSIVPITANAQDSIDITFSIESPYQGETESGIIKIEEIGYSNGLPDFIGNQRCDSTKDPSCTNAPIGLLANLVLPICEKDVISDCIAALRVKLDEGPQTKAEFLGYTDGRETTIKVGGQSLIGKTSGVYYALNKQGKKHYFLITANLKALLAKRMDGSEGKFQFPYFGIDVSEITFEPSIDCLATFENECISKTLSKNIFIETSLRLSSPPPNWLAGRMSGPTVLVTKNAYGSEVKISGQTVDVANVNGKVSPKLFYKYPRGFPESYIASLASQNGSLTIPPLFSLMYAEDVFKELKEKSTELKSYWQLSGSSRFTAFCSASLQGDCLQGGNGPCLDSSENFGGVLATNALAFSRNPPKIIDDEMQFLLASPHLLPDGKTTTGTFDLEMSSQALRCIYSLSNLPLRAEISVVNADGKVKVSSSIFAETKGIATISVKNFSYSVPKIKVKLSQTTSKSSITCIKGKTKKVISGANSVCPTGYKKVS